MVTRCAQSGRFRTTLDEAMAMVAATAPAPIANPARGSGCVECPLRDAGLTVGAARST